MQLHQFSRISCIGLVQGTRALPNVHNKGTIEKGIEVGKSKIYSSVDIELTCTFPIFVVKYLIVSQFISTLEALAFPMAVYET